MCCPGTHTAPVFPACCSVQLYWPCFRISHIHRLPHPFGGFHLAYLSSVVLHEVQVGAGVLGGPKRWEKPGCGTQGWWVVREKIEADFETWLFCPLQTTNVRATQGAWLFLNQNPRSDLTQRWLCLKFGVCGCLGWGTESLQALANRSRADKLTAVLWLWRLRTWWL